MWTGGEERGRDPGEGQRGGRGKKEQVTPTTDGEGREGGRCEWLLLLNEARGGTLMTCPSPLSLSFNQLCSSYYSVFTFNYDPN